jgi:sodium transport system ATP-binding protein
MIQAQQLTKTFNPGRGRVVHAVRDASFAVAGGEIFGLLGPNGAGKTTLLRMLATIISPTSGHCVVAGARSDTDPQKVRAGVGFLSGNTRLYRRLTAREVLRYFGRLYGLSDDFIHQRTLQLADMLAMHPFLDQRCHGLSTGQSQKVSIARVILHEPSVLILDEPTLGLDITDI